jgi:glycolate oxidase FAD binding subunit
VFDSCGLSPESGLALLRRVWSTPLESTGLSFINGTAFVRLEGSRAALNEKVAMLRTFCETDPQQNSEGELIFHKVASGQITGTQTNLWRVYVPPANALKLVADIEPSAWCADWAGGLLWVQCDRDVHATARTFGARAVSMRGDNSIPRFAPEDHVRADLTQRVKAAFDPLRLFNPGRMWEGV